MSFEEKRRAPRLRILDTFSFFVNVPKKSPARLMVHNLSALGISMNVDVEGEPDHGFPVRVGERFSVDFFVNPTLSMPVTVSVVRVEEREGGVRSIGAEFVPEESPGLAALQALVKLLDEIAKAQGISIR